MDKTKAEIKKFKKLEKKHTTAQWVCWNLIL